jgi:hypothetical protein
MRFYYFVFGGEVVLVERRHHRTIAMVVDVVLAEEALDQRLQVSGDGHLKFRPLRYS